MSIGTDALAFIGIPILRSVVGWFNHSIKDGRINRYEWRKLVETVINVGLIGVMVYLGLEQMGVDVSALGAASTAFVLDKLISAMKEQKQGKPKRK